jgi:heat-inducible transcriptional repressor
MEALHLIVQSYIETGEPVASRTIARKWLRGSVSAATIRNIMADLSDEGFLAQPHTSAGRIPTAKAFRAYVKSLVAGRLAGAELQRLREELESEASMESRVERSSHLLTELTRNVGITAAIPAATQKLEQVELLPLPESRVLMVLVTRDRMVRNRVVALDQPLSTGELASIRNYINRNFSGWVLSDVRRELERRLEQESAFYDAILKKLILLYDKGLLDVGLTAEVHMEGASNLVAFDFHLTRDKMRELFQALEEKKKILQLLDRFLDHSGEEVAVHVGLGEAHPSMSELALIGITVPMTGGLSARFAVLGPMRMNYSRVMAAVMHVGKAFCGHLV